ncbi:hypothetical protein [Pseudonocardia spirodelae]|uniref:Uncharacterized protein n=1 Tax=Pseudonocardia spirodelae TaxID=3133431 RepID=A0ABU8T1V5_9PSEU
MTTVLVIGFDPRAFTGHDPGPVLDGLAHSRARFRELGIDAREVLVDPADAPREAIAAALRADRYDCVLVGGGLRHSDEYLVLFEDVVNLVHRHAPDAEIAFNATPATCAEAVLRRVGPR